MTVVERYLRLGLELGRHIDGLVDAYYGPPEIAAEVAARPTPAPTALVASASALVADLDAGVDDLDPVRRRWLRAQALGLRTTARRLDGEELPYVDEVEACYGVRPEAVPEDALAEAHRALEVALPGPGPVRERVIAWRESHAVPVDRLRGVIDDLVEDLRERTDRLFGLPDGERVDIEMVTDEPWSGFNHYLGELHSRVEINVDLPVLSLGLGHLVAHEAYPGHHTEHVRKEAGLVRSRRQLEETIFCVGTPQCLLAEGLADLGLEVVVGARPEPWLAEHLAAAGLPYEPEVAAVVADASRALSDVRANLALQLHAEGRPVDEVMAYAERWGLLPHDRAAKAVAFLTDPTWRSYVHCYSDGLRLTRRWVGGDPARFERLITEQLVPEDLSIESAAS